MEQQDMINIQKKRAFTLIELLTAIAIIGILIGLLTPALRMSRKRAKTVECMKNLKEIAHLIGLYEIDKQVSPSSLGDLKSAFSSQVPNALFKCPVDQKEYKYDVSALDTTGVLIEHTGDHSHEVKIYLTGLLNVQRGNTNT